MTALPLPASLDGHAATDAHFGANILAPRAAMTGPGSYAEAIEELGVSALRYPGGSLTEAYFDIGDPDAARVTDNETGEEIDFMPISDLMGYAAATGQPVTLVIPTRTALSETELDELGNRLPDIDEAELRDFVRDTVTGEYGDATIAAFEIGNEYWGAGRMNSAEYGRLAAEMTEIIDDELARIAEETGTPVETDIIVQMGQNYDHADLEDDYAGLSNEEILADLNETYGLELTAEEAVSGSGRINWQLVNNEIVIQGFEDAGALDEVDGVTAHVFSKAPEIENSRYNDITQIENTWHEVDPDLEIHVTEWNQKSTTEALDRTEDYGLYQAHEMLNMLEVFLDTGVDAAHVWPLIQNTRNALSGETEHDDPTAPGEMFAMMSESLPGKTAIDFLPDDRETEYRLDGIDVHGFTDAEDIVFYIASTSRFETQTTKIDISGLVVDQQAVSARQLGVAEGDAPGDTDSQARLELLAEEEVLEDGVITATLAPGEILEITLSGVVPTEDFAPVMAAAAASEEPSLYEELMIDDPAPAEVVETDDGSSEGGDGGGDGGEDGADMDIFLGLLPLLVLGGIVGF
ncbi:type I secretion protein [Roseivivax sp.]